MQKVLDATEMERMGRNLRLPDGKPAVEKPAPEKNDVAEAMKLVAQAIANIKQPEPPNYDVLITAIKGMLSQHRAASAELVEAIREALEPREEVSEAPPPAPPEEWEFKIVRDRAGRIDTVKARKL
jgi:hypothetical protein